MCNRNMLYLACVDPTLASLAGPLQANVVLLPEDRVANVEQVHFSFLRYAHDNGWYVNSTYRLISSRHGDKG
jgi:hypothetical protein